MLLRFKRRVVLAAMLLVAAGAGYTYSVLQIKAIRWGYQMELIEASQKIDALEEEVANYERMCMAKNVYFEAGVEPYHGKLAVGAVVMNRVASDKYPNTPCEVIHQPAQFSWTQDGRSDVPVYESETWRESERAADAILFGKGREVIGSLIDDQVHNYHATYVNPNWAAKMVPAAKIGQHIFYKE